MQRLISESKYLKGGGGKVKKKVLKKTYTQGLIIHNKINNRHLENRVERCHALF